jgi:cell division protein ZapA
MANINIKFNNKDYLLSCDDGQEEDLKNLTKFLDKKYSNLKEKLGNIGENKLLLITTIQVIDEYFNLKKKVMSQKENFENLSKKFKEMKSLVINYKEGKETEISKLNMELDKFKEMVEESQSIYETMLEKTTKSLEEIIEKTETSSKVQ